MKKQVTYTLIFLVVSMGGAILLHNFFNYSKTMELPTISLFIKWTIGIFVGISIVLYATKPKEKSARVPDGYHELTNANNQLTKKGLFEGGKQVSGTRHVYNKDGTFSHIENCKNGVYTKDVLKS